MMNLRMASVGFSARHKKLSGCKEGHWLTECKCKVWCVFLNLLVEEAKLCLIVVHYRY